MKKLDPDTLKKLEEIAKDVLEIETLETQMSDSLDFHEVSVWGLKEALIEAYSLGKSNSEAYSDKETIDVQIAEIELQDDETGIFRVNWDEDNFEDLNKALKFKLQMFDYFVFVFNAQTGKILECGCFDYGENKHGEAKEVPLSKWTDQSIETLENMAKNFIEDYKESGKAWEDLNSKKLFIQFKN